MPRLPEWGTLRGAGDEKAGRCPEGVLEDGVGVAIFQWTPDGTWLRVRREEDAVNVEGRPVVSYYKGSLRWKKNEARVNLRGEAHASHVLADD